MIALTLRITQNPDGKMSFGVDDHVEGDTSGEWATLRQFAGKTHDDPQSLHSYLVRLAVSGKSAIDPGNS